MLNQVLLTVLLLFTLAIVLNIRTFVSTIRLIPSNGRILVYLWILMLLGMTLWVQHQSGSFLSSSYAFQLGSVALIAFVVFTLLAQVKFAPGVWSKGLKYFMAYSVFCMLTAMISVEFAFSLYKASLMVLDVFIVVLAISLVGQYGKHKIFLDITYALLQLFVFMAVVSAVVWPDQSLLKIKSVVGVHLYGVVPYLNPNELGFISAITTLVGLRRFSDASTWRMKYLFISMVAISFIVCFLSQSRTSIIALTLGLIAFGIGIRKLRWVAVLAIVFIVSLLVVYMITGASVGIEDTITSYMKRGLSDEKIATMSGRTGLWQYGWQVFLDSPIYGHGFEAGTRFNTEYGLKGHMHNAHMQILVNTGAIGMILWLLMIVSVGRHLIIKPRIDKFNINSSEGRYHFEVLVIYGVMILRTITGSVLVSHQYSLVIFMGILVYLYGQVIKDNDLFDSDSKEYSTRILTKRKHKLIRLIDK